MSNGQDTKTCPLCAETIKATARVCPFCRSRQQRWILWTYDVLAGLAVLLLLGIGIAVFREVAPDFEGEGGRSYSGHRQDLQVQEAGLLHASRSDRVWVTGYVTNQGSYPWRAQVLETRLIDSQGALVDVYHSRIDDSIVVPPHERHAFRSEIGRFNPAVGNVTPLVRVQSAIDGNRVEKSK